MIMSEGYVRGNAKPGTCLKCERDVEQMSTHLGIEHGTPPRPHSSIS